MDGSRMSVRCTTIAESGSPPPAKHDPSDRGIVFPLERGGRGAVPPRSWPIREASRQGEGDCHGHRRGSAHYRRFECRCRVRRNEDGNRPVLTVRNRSRAVSHVDPIDSEPTPALTPTAASMPTPTPPSTPTSTAGGRSAPRRTRRPVRVRREQRSVRSDTGGSHVRAEGAGPVLPVQRVH